MVKAGFIVINKNGCSDVHGVDKDEALCYSAFLDALLNLGCNIDKGPSGRHLKPQLFTIAFHFKCPPGKNPIEI
jgi:hypothetical protein